MKRSKSNDNELALASVVEAIMLGTVELMDWHEHVVQAPATTEEGASKLVRLELSPKVHQDFRVESAKQGLPMALMARRVIEEWVAARKAGSR